MGCLCCLALPGCVCLSAAAVAEDYAALPMFKDKGTAVHG